MPSTKATILRRYTELPSLLALLQRQEITLLSPLSWDDKNDRESMARYAQANGLKSALGVCFSQAAETYHHWKVFAPGSSGICIEFHKTELLEAVPKVGFVHKKVAYKKPAEFLSGYPKPSQLPFIKGWAYRHEIEYRIIYASDTENTRLKAFPFALSCIRSITLSPWLPSPLFEAAKSAILATKGCINIPVVQSKVVENESWLAYVNGDANPTIEKVYPGKPSQASHVKRYTSTNTK